MPLFQTNCAKSGCHDSVTMQEGHQFDRYATIVAHGINAGDSSNSEIYKVITAGAPSRIMPKFPNKSLTAAQIHIIATWIQQGAANSTNCALACDISLFTYSGAVRPILQTHCLGCHSGLAVDGGFISLDTYDGVKEQVTINTLYPAITHTGPIPMPKIGKKLSDCKIAIIKKWIEAGAPDN